MEAATGIALQSIFTREGILKGFCVVLHSVHPCFGAVRQQITLVMHYGFASFNHDLQQPVRRLFE